MSITIAFDTSPLQAGHRVRGIGTYITELCAAIQANLPVGLTFTPLDFGKHANRLPNYDLLHYPYFDLFFPSLPFRKPAKTLVTIHDVTPLLFPDHYPPGFFGKFNYYRQVLSLQTVRQVITDSFQSKADISRYLGYPASKISSIYLGAQKLSLSQVKPASLTAVTHNYHLPAKFVLYVGDVNYNKNLVSLAKACHQIKCVLVIVGKQAASTDFDQRHVENQPLVDLLAAYGQDPLVKRLGYVSDQDLAALYSLASVYCQPSYYEGFGLPVLEAMAQGCPVACANTGSLPEIAGQAAVMFDPYNIDQIAKSLLAIITDSALRTDLMAKGKLQAHRFTWHQTARQTLELYTNLAHQ